MYIMLTVWKDRLLEYLSTTELRPYEKNARKHHKKDVENITVYDL